MFRDIKYICIHVAGREAESLHLICEFILFYQLHNSGKKTDDSVAINISIVIAE